MIISSVWDRPGLPSYGSLRLGFIKVILGGMEIVTTWMFFTADEVG